MPASVCSLPDSGVAEIRGLDYPRSTFAVLRRRQGFLLDQPAYGCFADIQNLGRFFYRDLAALGAFTVAVTRDPAMIAQEADA